MNENTEAFQTPARPQVYTTMTAPEDRPNGGKVLFAAMIATAIIVVGLLAYSIFNEVSDNRANCERAVVTREDTRFMWLELFRRFPDSEEADELHIILDQRLPSLTCPPTNDQDQIPLRVDTLP